MGRKEHDYSLSQELKLYLYQQRWQKTANKKKGRETNLTVKGFGERAKTVHAAIRKLIVGTDGTMHQVPRV